MSSPIPRHFRRLQIYSQRQVIATKFFTGHPSSVSLHASVPTIDSLSTYDRLPEVLFMGRSNSGKSKLISHIFKRRGLAIAGKTPGGTKCLNFYRLQTIIGNPSPQLILVDAPGYGDRGRPEWGTLVEHYLHNRNELRLVCILINAEHGVTSYDKLMLQTLEVASRSRGFTLQAILSKCDKVPPPLQAQVLAHRQRAISACSPSCLPPIPTAIGNRDKFGMQPVRLSILEACGFVRSLPSPYGPNDDL